MELFLSALDFSTCGLTMPLRSFARPDLFLLVSDFTHPGSPVFSKSISKADSFPSLFGAFQCGLSLSVSDFSLFGPSVVPQSSGCAGSLLPVSSTSCLDSSTFALDCTHLESVLSSHSFSCPGLVVVVLDFLHLEFLPPLQLHGCFDSSLFALNFSHLGAPTLPRSIAWFDFFVSLWAVGRLGPVLFALDFLHLGSSLSLHSLSHLGSFVSCLDTVLFGASLLPRSSAYLGAAVLAANFSQLETLLFVRSFSYSDPTSSILDFALSDLSLLLHNLGCGESSLALFGTSCLDVMPFALDTSRSDSLLFIRSLCYVEFTSPSFSQQRLGAPMVTLDNLMIGSSLPLRSSSQMSTPLSAFGLQ